MGSIYFLSMASERDQADLFAIPDLWRSSSFLDKTLVDINKQNPFFSADSLTSRNGNSQSLLKASSWNSPELYQQQKIASKPKTDEGANFFALPAILDELVQQGEHQDVHQEEHQAKSLFTSGNHEIRNEPAPAPVPDFPLDTEDDLWLGGDDQGLSQQLPECKTWEKFEGDTISTSPAFITESGPDALDAVITSSHRSHGNVLPDILDYATYCACLLNLALGRSSVLFSWDATRKSFIKTAPHLRVSGLSLEAIHGIDVVCLDCANAIKRLQAFTGTIYSVSSESNPTRVALAGVVDQLVLVIQSELSTRGREARSLIQLQAVVRPAQTVLIYFQQLVEKLASERSEEAMLSRLFHEAQSAEYRNGLLRDAVCEVLRLVSKPWTDFVEEWIGLKVEGSLGMTKRSPSRGFVKVGDHMWIDDQGFELEETDFFLDEDGMPSFVPSDIAQAMFETGRNLRFLREHHSEHPLAKHKTVASAKPPGLAWQFDWDAIKELEVSVNRYQDAVLRAIRNNGIDGLETEPETSRHPLSSEPNKYELTIFGKTEDQIAASILDSMNRLNQALIKSPEHSHHSQNIRSQHAAEDGLGKLLRDRLYRDRSLDTADSSSEGFSPHWSLVPLLSFGPVIAAQSRLVNHECMKLLFTAHNLRVHVDLLRQYFLLSNGLLCSRLSHALFDPDMETAERQTGVALGVGTGGGNAGVMGLRLGGRDTWPPASSELRLALMGVLSDSYQAPSSRARYSPRSHGNTNSSATSNRAATTTTTTSPYYQKGSPVVSPDLPGDLSFAVRELSAEEIDRCMDPDGLEALDFLRLAYKPPAALRPIMTPVVLTKYDRIFRHLLRVLRMLYVVTQLVRDVQLSSSMEPLDNASTRFCAEARHFVGQMAAYFFETGIAAPWKRFELLLDGVEGQVLGYDDDSDDEGDPTKEKVAGASTSTSSPDTVRESLERVLDEILLALLLRKRQAPVLKLLEEIFAIVLKFAKMVRLRALSRRGRGKAAAAAAGLNEQKETQTPARLYAVFRKKVEVFIAVCKGLSEKTGLGGSSEQERMRRREGGGDGMNLVEAIPLMLDYLGYYDKTGGGWVGAMV